MGFTEQYAVAQDVGFIGRVAIAISQAAIAINGELASTPHAAQRGALAVKVLTEPPLQWARIFAFGVAADETITTGSTDAAIFARVSAIWNDYALAHTA